MRFEQLAVQDLARVPGGAQPAPPVIVPQRTPPVRTTARPLVGAPIKLKPNVQYVWTGWDYY
jgi:hypothetical protein